MNKRIGFISCVCMCLLVLTGCTGDNNYTQEEENVLADYMAQIVFKHSEGYNYKLVNVIGNPFIHEEIDEGDSDLNIEDESNKDNTDKTKDQDGDSNKDLDRDDESKEKTSLASALGFDKNIDVKVMKTKVSDELSKEAYYLEAGKNKKICTVTLKISNKGSKSVQVKNNGSSIRLLINDNKYKPKLTPLENDISFLSCKIGAKKSKDIIIVFEINDKDSKKAKSLMVETKDKKTTIELD